MVKKLGKHPVTLVRRWVDDKAKAFGKGLTVIRSDQCPYIVDAAKHRRATAANAGIKSRVIELRSRRTSWQLSPSAYSVSASSSTASSSATTTSSRKTFCLS